MGFSLITFLCMKKSPLLNNRGDFPVGTAQPRKIITHAEQKVKEKMCGKMTKNVYPDLCILRIDNPGFW